MVRLANRDSDRHGSVRNHSDLRGARGVERISDRMRAASHKSGFAKTNP